VTQSPRFPEEGVESERAAAVAGVIALRDDMYRYPMRLVTQAAFEGHVYGVPVSGTEESLRAISTQSLRDWHRRSVLEGSPVLAVVGDGDADALAAAAAHAFNALRPAVAPPPVPFEWPAGRRDRVERREKAQTALAIAFPSPGRADDDRFAAALIATVASGLGGRFFDELREKRSLCYTVQAFQSERRLAGAFLAYIATSPEQEEAARAGLIAEFEKLRERPVSDEELRRAQTYAIGVHAIRQQSGAAVLADVVDAWLYGHLAELDSHDAQIRAVTTARMQEVAHRYFDPELRAEGVVRGVGKAV
jgi:zinc protease